MVQLFVQLSGLILVNPRKSVAEKFFSCTKRRPRGPACIGKPVVEL